MVDDPVQGHGPPWRRLTGRGALGRGRTAAGWSLGLLGPPLLTALLLRGREVLGLPTDLMMFFTLVVATALVGGLIPSLVCALLASSLLNYFFTEPTGGLTIADPENALALVVFALVAVAVASVVDLAERRRADALEAREEATALAELSRAVLAGRDTPEGVVQELAGRFRADRALVLERAEPTRPWHVVAVFPDDDHGRPADDEPPTLDPPTSRVVGHLAFALPGHRLGPGEDRVLTAFAEQAAVVLDRARFRAQAERARDLEHLDAARTAILAAASHDLRTPLAAVRAAVDGLGRHGPHLDAADRASLVDAIENGTARLERLIDNLLDLSRLQMGAVRPRLQAVSLEEIVPLAVDGLEPEAIILDLPEDLPLIVTDAGLLERVIANLAANAVLHAASSDEPARVTASLRDGQVDVVVVDHGPGVPADKVDHVFAAFTQLGTTPTAPATGGLGLGLAVVRGLADALGAPVHARATDGGGLTVTVTVPVARTPDRETPS